MRVGGQSIERSRNERIINTEPSYPGRAWKILLHNGRELCEADSDLFLHGEMTKESLRVALADWIER
jgi:hypothetical protein